MGAIGPNGGGLLQYLLNNLPALAASLSAAVAILSAHKKRTLWVWIYAISAFFFTFFSQAHPTEKTDSNADNSESSTQDQ